MRRLVALALPLALLAAALTGCVTNLPTAAVDWLAGRDGVADAQVLADNTGAWSSSGLVRGELDPGIDDAQIGRLVDEIEAYAPENGNVAFWLGWDRRDFSVSGDTEAAVALWRDVVDIPGVVSGIVFDDQVRLRSLRADAVATFDALEPFEQAVRLEAFADKATLSGDELADVEFDQPNPLAVEYIRGDCVPPAGIRSFVDSLLTHDGITGATADLCTGITIDVPADGSVATQALALRSDLDARALSDFAVQLTSEVDGPGTVHFAAITPGDPSRLPVLEVFEREGAPVVSYSLGPDGALAVTAYDVPTADLLALVQGAPAASRLSGIGIEGDPVAVVAPLDRLPALLDEALALDAASEHFGSVQLGPGFGVVALQAEGANTPDVAAAAADLRASGATDRRFFSVRYAAFQADIANGVAALSDPGYVGADVMQSFVDAWNAPAGG